MRRNPISSEGMKRIAQSYASEATDYLDQVLSEIEDAYGHLGAAIMQSIPEDDQIIMGHVRDAYNILEGVWRKLR